MTSIVRNVLGFVHSLAVSIFILSLQAVLVLFALDCFCGILVHLVDARQQVTVAQRIGLTLIFGSFGILGAVGAYKLKAYYRRITPSERVTPRSRHSRRPNFRP